MTKAEAAAALDSLPAVERISVASLKPTDVIVVNVSEYISMETAERMRAYLREIWPDNKIVVLEKGVELRIADGADAPDIGADVPGWRCGMTTSRRGFFRTFTAAAAGTLVPKATAAPKVAASVGETLKDTVHLDGRALAEIVLGDLPRPVRQQGLW